MLMTITVTPQQTQLLASNPHLVPVELLIDGDVLALDVLDLSDSDPHEGTQLYGPYILTTDGQLQPITNHYRNHHGVR